MAKVSQATNVASISAGSAERIIEDRAPAIDGYDPGNADLAQPNVTQDETGIEELFTAKLLSQMKCLPI